MPATFGIAGLFKALFRPRDSIVGSGYAFYTGGSSSGKAVTQRRAMQLTAVYSCVRILSEAIAGLPLRLYVRGADGVKKKASDLPLYRLLHDEPTPEMSSFVFRETLMAHLLLWGNAYAQVIRSGRGKVLALYPLMPDRMSADRDEDGRLYYSYIKEPDDGAGMENGTVRLSPRDVLHIPGLGFDGLVPPCRNILLRTGRGICAAPQPSLPAFSLRSAAVPRRTGAPRGARTGAGTGSRPRTCQGRGSRTARSLAL